MFKMSWVQFLLGTQIFFFVPPPCHVDQFTLQNTLIFYTTSIKFADESKESLPKRLRHTLTKVNLKPSDVRS